MAKVRVYELARELNMESKVLVEKLIAGGVQIKNYMSTLDESEVGKARDIATGKVSEVVEEKRVKPTVIRRRKKTVRVQPEEVPAEAPEAEAEAEAEELPGAEVEEEAVPAEQPAEAPEPEPEAVSKRVRKKALPEEPEEAAAPEEAAKEAEAVEEEKPPLKAKEKVKGKKAKKKGGGEPAKIIKKAEEGPLKEVVKRGKVQEIPARRKPAPFEPPVPPEAVPPPPRLDEDGKPIRKKEKKKAAKKEQGKKGAVKGRKLEVFERDALYEGRYPGRKGKKGAKKGRETGKRFKQTEITTPKAIKRRIKVPEQVTVGDLAKAMGVKASEVIRAIMAQGAMANINQPIDFDTASLVADDFGYELELDVMQMKDLLGEVEDKPEDLKPRPPVVTIMGHVDHGKTSLLDYIRKSNIIEGESGGITQHIGAYYVSTDSGDVVFLDTPGHEAFTAMRARGAKVTDIIVLVVAADDGVMPQTKEAVNHARAAGIPIIVAVNKMDKEGADPERVKRELAELDLAPEEWGGETLYAQLSAKTGEGVNDLMELISLQSEILELKANPDRSAQGTIIEARLDKSRGSVATVLIKAGTLKQGDFFICGENYGRIRAMVNNRGQRMDQAGPSVPVEIYGISGVPKAGDDFVVVQDEKSARQVAEHRQGLTRGEGVDKRGIVSLDDLFERIKEGEVKELNIILKADVQGSIEAISDSLLKLSTGEVKLKIIHSSTGAITETDIMLASASGAIVIGFNVRANPRVREVAERENVDIRYYDVIYNLIKDIRDAMAGMLEPEYREHVIGRVNVKETFHVPKAGTIAGCQVTDGHVLRNSNVRLLRDDVVVFDGKINSLKRFKEDVKEVQTGYECGIGLENFQDIKPGDVLEVYELEAFQPEL
ncbi:MAG: translation initiation factor IF-2 [Deltaproteobacteria bacterium]|nr:translation initiation factor IF-2 [Deltaproteobacteria bacterium]